MVSYGLQWQEMIYRRVSYLIREETTPMKTGSLTTQWISGEAFAQQIPALARPRYRGQAAFIMTFATTLLIGAVAVTADVVLFYLNWVR